MATSITSSTNLPALFGNGGLLLYADCFNLRDEADILIERNGVKTRDQLLTLIMLMRSFGNKATIKHLLVAGVKRHLFKKEDLITIYKMQTQGARTRGALITLTDIWGIPTLAFPRKGEQEKLPMNWFSQEDIIRLAEETLEVNHVDLVLFFQHWFYGSAHPLLLGKKFLEYWYKKTGETHGGDIDGKIASLIAIALYNNHPEVIDLDGVLKRFEALSRRDPNSHGTYRYLGLAFDVAGKDKVKRKKVLEAWVNRIIEMIVGGASLFRGAQLSIELLIRERGIPEREKKELLQRIDKVAKETAEQYSKLVSDAQEMVDAI